MTDFAVLLFRTRLAQLYNRPRVCGCFLNSRQNIHSRIRNMDTAELAKKAAAYKAIDTHVSGDSVIGIGSGTTIVYAVERLAQKVRNGDLHVVCVPTSIQAKQLIRKYKLVLSDLEEHPELDVVFDGADEVDSNLTLIKGGGGCLTQEKVVASCSKKLVVMTDYRKNSTYLGEKWKQGIPIEVIPMAYVPIIRRLDRLGGDAELRMAKAKAGPVVTDNGNFILDWKSFPSKKQPAEWLEIDKEISFYPGVVATGLFVDMASVVYFGQADGSVQEKNADL